MTSLLMSRYLTWADVYENAACKETPRGFFFPTNEEPWKAQVAFCRQCPVRLRCLKMAIDDGLNYGIFGGLNARQRRDKSRVRREYLQDVS